MFKVEDVKKYLTASDELISALRNHIPTTYDEEENPLECLEFDFENERFALIEVDQSDWDDEGKYQYREETYQLVSYDTNKSSYPNDNSVINKYNIVVSICVQRCGSYFTEYYYSYSDCKISKTVIKHIPVKVIPAHDEVTFVEI